jgi:RING finger protein 170
MFPFDREKLPLGKFRMTLWEPWEPIEGNVEKESGLGPILLGLAVGTLLIGWWVKLLLDHCRRRRGFDGRRDVAPTRDEAERVAAALRRRPLTEEVLQDHTCSVCYDTMAAPAELLPCGHVFCTECILQWWSQLGTYRRVRCPNCRTLVELIVPAYRVRERAGQPPENAEADQRIRQYNTHFTGAGGTVRGFFASIAHVVTNQRFLPFLIRVRIYAIYLSLFIYIVSPFDLLSEAALGIVGLLDDLIFFVIVAFLLFSIAVQTMQRR